MDRDKLKEVIENKRSDLKTLIKQGDRDKVLLLSKELDDLILQFMSEDNIVEK